MILPEALDAILDAVRLGRTDIVKALLEKVKSDGNDLDLFINQSLSGETTLLGISVEGDEVDVCRALLREGSDPSAQNASGETVFQRIKSESLHRVFDQEFLQAAASDCGDLKKLQRFLTSGMKITETFDDSRTRNNPLHWAASFGAREALEFLIRNVETECIDSSNSQGVTPFHEAANRGDPEIIKTLSNAHADPYKIVTDGKWKGKNVIDLMPAHIKDTISAKPQINGDVSDAEIVNEPLPTENGELSIKNEDFLKYSDTYFNSEPDLADERLKLLWPPPQRIREIKGDDVLEIGLKVSLTVSPGNLSVHEILDIWDRYRTLMYEQTKRCVILSNEGDPVSSFDSQNVSGIHVSVNPEAFNISGSYRLIVSSKNGIKLISRDELGIHYGITTILQLFRLYFDSENTGLIRLKPVVINDYPESVIRGVLLDLNVYGRVPRVELLLSMIEMWSFFKVNHFHVFIRLSKSKTWQLPYSKINMLSIDRYCRQRAINFVPAIDISHDVSTFEDAKTVSHAFHEIMVCFDSAKFLHLGPRLTSLLSKSPHYFNAFLTPIRTKRITLMLCSNIFSKTDSNNLPIDAILLHYEFSNSLRLPLPIEDLFEKGHSFAFCSGTHAWSSFTGSPQALMCNLLSVQRFSSGINSSGTVNAHWAGDPSFNHLAFAWPGYILSSGLAWNPKVMSEDDLSRTLVELLGLYIVENNDVAKALVELGRAEESIRPQCEISALLRLFTHCNEEHEFLKNHKLDDFGSIIQTIRKIQTKLLRIKSPKQQEDQSFFGSNTNKLSDVKEHFPLSGQDFRASWTKEVHLSSELLLLAARIGRGLVAIENPKKDEGISSRTLVNLPPTFKTDIANRLLSHIDTYKTIWASRYLISGLEESLSALMRLFKTFVPESDN